MYRQCETVDCELLDMQQVDTLLNNFPISASGFVVYEVGCWHLPADLSGTPLPRYSARLEA